MKLFLRLAMAFVIPALLLGCATLPTQTPGIGRTCLMLMEEGDSLRAISYQPPCDPSDPRRPATDTVRSWAVPYPQRCRLARAVVDLTGGIHVEWKACTVSSGERSVG